MSIKISLALVATLTLLLSINANAELNFSPQILQCTYAHGEEDSPSGLVVYDYKFVVGNSCPPPEEPFDGHITEKYHAVDSSGLLFEGTTRDREKCKVRLTIVGGHIQ